MIDQATGEPVAWHPAPMVLPVSERLREQVADRDFRARCEAARERFDFVVDR